MTVEYGTILMGLIGGLALFLYGMEQLTQGLKSAAGWRMKGILSRLTRNRFRAAFAGAFVTAIIQSSSVTTVLVVGFISAGLMSLTQSIGVIMGANIGTTITAQIVAFKVTHYALILVAVGALSFLFSKNEKTRQLGMILLGLGLIFYGMDLMSNAARPLRSFEPFVAAMRTMESPLYGILIGAVFTGVIQSSSATTGVIIVLAGQGFISLEAGIALAFGANIGTCITAMLASIGKKAEAVRAAVVHIVFNIVGVVIWFAFIEELATFVRWFSPAADELSGMQRLAAETPRQIANAHTTFNVVNTLLFIGFVNPAARLVRWIVPEKEKNNEPLVRARYLDDVLLETPDLALDRVRMELQRLGERALYMMNISVPTVVQGSAEKLSALGKLGDEVDSLYEQIVGYLGRLSTGKLRGDQSRLLSLYMMAANNLESIGDIIETNLLEAGLTREEQGIRFSRKTEDMLLALQVEVCGQLENTLEALDRLDIDLALKVVGAKPAITRLSTDLEQRLAGRLTTDDHYRVSVFKIETELIEYQKRVYYFAKRIAKEIAAYEKKRERPDSRARKEKVATR